MKKEFLPVDFGHLEDKVLYIVDCFRKANDQDRSCEYRKHHLENAESVSKTLLRDFGYYFDEYLFGGIEPYDLSNKNTPPPLKGRDNNKNCMTQYEQDVERKKPIKYIYGLVVINNSKQYIKKKKQIII